MMAIMQYRRSCNRYSMARRTTMIITNTTTAITGNSLHFGIEWWVHSDCRLPTTRRKRRNTDLSSKKKSHLTEIHTPFDQLTRYTLSTKVFFSSNKIISNYLTDRKHIHCMHDEVALSRADDTRIFSERSLPDENQEQRHLALLRQDPRS